MLRKNFFSFPSSLIHSFTSSLRYYSSYIVSPLAFNICHTISYIL